MIDNELVNCQGYGIKIMVAPQAIMCGNDVELPPDADADEVSDYTVNATLTWQVF